jgi:hypothetical protein
MTFLTRLIRATCAIYIMPCVSSRCNNDLFLFTQHSYCRHCVRFYPPYNFSILKLASSSQRHADFTHGGIILNIQVCLKYGTVDRVMLIQNSKRFGHCWPVRFINQSWMSEAIKKRSKLDSLRLVHNNNCRGRCSGGSGERENEVGALSPEDQGQ